MKLIRELLVLREEEIADADLPDRFQEFLDDLDSLEVSEAIGDNAYYVSYDTPSIYWNVKAGNFIADLHDDPGVQTALKSANKTMTVTLVICGSELSQLDSDYRMPGGGEIDEDTPYEIKLTGNITYEMARKLMDEGDDPDVYDVIKALKLGQEQVISTLKDHKRWDDIKQNLGFDEDEEDSCPACGAHDDGESKACPECGYQYIIGEE
jgi:hypothetical protein